MNDQNNWGYPPQQQAQPQQQGYPPQQAQPQQGYTQQQQGYPTQPTQPPMGYSTQQPPMGYPTQQQPQAPQMLQQMPQYARPNEQLMMQAYQEHRANSGSGGYNFVKFPPDDWSMCQVGFKSVVRVYLLPPWAEGKPIFAIEKSHFWKSAKYPNGRGITCPGGSACEICNASNAAMSSGFPDQQKRAKDWGRVNTKYLYQVAMLDNMALHFQEDPMRPFLLKAGSKLHGHIGNLIEDKSISICDPQQGRPLKLKREKTGTDKMSIEYSCTDEDPSPLPQQLWGLLNNLIDLEEVAKVPTQQEMFEAVIDMGLQPSSILDNPYQVQQSSAQPYEQPVQGYTQPPMQQQNPAPPQLVQPGGYGQNPPDMSPPPINTGSANPPQQYYPQPSQQGQQLQAQPQPPVQRTPVQPDNQQGQQPQTLEQLQRAAQGK